jgi:N-acetyl sugar amidotransferase
MPHTKPDLRIDEEGICNACRSFEARKHVDWDARKRQLTEIFEKHRSRDGSNWDCIVPVSGGKDSTYQVVRMLQLGANPLCVTASTCDLSEIGRKNIENIKSLGVDLVEFSPNPVIRAKLNAIGLRQVGDISWPEHVGIFTIPVRAAVQYGVRLIVWGENSQNEYGGPAAAAETQTLDRRWLEEFGGLLGLRVTDLPGMDGIRPKDLIPYTYPSDEELKRAGVTGIFLGYFLPWDGLSNALIAQANGFTTYDRPVEGAMLNYENLDNNFHGIHDYFKFLKFGFGRATDHACLHLRRGRITRQDALDIVRRHDGRFPWSYLGRPLAAMLEKIGMEEAEFVQLCDQFANKKIFLKDASGKLRKDRHGNLTKTNYDNVEGFGRNEP